MLQLHRYTLRCSKYPPQSLAISFWAGLLGCTRTNALRGRLTCTFCAGTGACHHLAGPQAGGGGGRRPLHRQRQQRPELRFQPVLGGRLAQRLRRRRARGRRGGAPGQLGRAPDAIPSCRRLPAGTGKPQLYLYSSLYPSLYPSLHRAPNPTRCTEPSAIPSFCRISGRVSPIYTLCSSSRRSGSWGGAHVSCIGCENDNLITSKISIYPLCKTALNPHPVLLSALQVSKAKKAARQRSDSDTAWRFRFKVKWRREQLKVRA